jgi:hypothetical protein
MNDDMSVEQKLEAIQADNAALRRYLGRIETDLSMSIRLLQSVCKKLELADEVDSIFATWERELEERRVERLQRFDHKEEDTGRHAHPVR